MVLWAILFLFFKAYDNMIYSKALCLMLLAGLFYGIDVSLKNVYELLLIN